MAVRTVLAMLFLFVAPAIAERVTFNWEKFKMQCPEEGKWFKNEKELTDKREKTLELDYNSETKGLYSCSYTEDDKDKLYYFYVRGKACPNCVELDPFLFGSIICADVVGTAIVMILIYKCGKKNSSAETVQPSRAPARSGGRAPPVPSPDYEKLNVHTRSMDPYSVVNRMG